MKDKKDTNHKLLNDLNELLINLTEDVTIKNYIDIIVYLQKHKIDTNNSYIDKIINEEDEQKKLELINDLNSFTEVDMTSSGYIAQLFFVFNNNENFCFKESKTSECIICGKKGTEQIKELKPFIYVNINNIKEKNIFNILLDKCKENYIYDDECRKNSKEDLLCTKVKYNIENYPIFIIVLFDMVYKDLLKYKDNIY